MSGVLATVAAGLYTGSRLSCLYAPRARLQAFAFLDVLVFLLNTVQFTMLGTQLVRVVNWLPGLPAVRTVVALSVVTGLVIGSRLAWTLPEARLSGS